MDMLDRAKKNYCTFLTIKIVTPFHVQDCEIEIQAIMSGVTDAPDKTYSSSYGSTECPETINDENFI